MAWADRAYRSVLLSTRFFSRGWGPVETYEKLMMIGPAVHDRVQCSALLADHLHPVTTKKVRSLPEGDIYDGMFRSPVATLLPGFLPRESEVARFEMLVPRFWKSSARPMYIHLAGTGDHYFWRRRYLSGLPTLKEANFGSVLLENPFYGSRKPRNQVRSQLHHVSDLFVMGLALILECMRLLRWMEDDLDLGPVGLTGVSMGGHNASLAASLWPKPVAIVPCLSWVTASCVFCEGLLSNAVCWNVLEEQLFYSRIGRDEERRELFQYISERHRSAEHFKIISSEQYSGEINDPTKLSNRKRRRKYTPHQETVSTLRTILDVATHLATFPSPLVPQLAVFVAAKDDVYVPRQNVSDVRSVWPGCEVRYVEGGHVSSAVLNQSHFRHALVDAMNKVLETATAATKLNPVL